MTSPLYARVQRALAIDRQERVTFAHAFMGMTGRELGDDDIVVEFEDDATFRDSKGELSRSALGILADATLGSVVRMKVGPLVRTSTVHLEVQMTGASTQEHVVAQGHFVTFCERGRVRQALSTATIKSGETLIAHASEAFVLVDLPEGQTHTTRPWRPERSEPQALDTIMFDADEREALRSCERAEAAATEAFPFIEHFWCGIPKAKEGKAHLSFKVTPHLGNLAGHVHGGLLLGTVARVANAATPDNMRLSNISAWFVSPGVGPQLEVRSSVVQQGRNLALVRSQILGASGKLVLEAMSQHVAAE